MAARSATKYISGVPHKNREGLHLCHNFRPGTPDVPNLERAIGMGGFRAWWRDPALADPALADWPGVFVHCHCGWAPDITEHYTNSRVDPHADGPS